MSDEPVTKIQPHDQVLLIVVCRRSLDELSTQVLFDDILTAASRRPGVPIVLDMERVKFAPSVALGSLLQLSKSFSFERRRIVLIGIDPRVLQTIRVTRLDRVLEIRGSLDEVVQSLRRPDEPTR